MRCCVKSEAEFDSDKLDGVVVPDTEESLEFVILMMPRAKSREDVIQKFRRCVPASQGAHVARFRVALSPVAALPRGRFSFVSVFLVVGILVVGEYFSLICCFLGGIRPLS